MLAASSVAQTPAVLVAVEVRAPAASVAALVGDPSAYTRFVSVLHDVHVTGRHERSVSYDWTWSAAMLELHGHNELDAFPPPPAHTERGWQFSGRATQGDLGVGRIAWRVLPTGASASLLTVAIRLDLHQASYVGRELSGGGHAVDRAISLALASALALGTRREAERLAHAPARTGATHGDAGALVWPPFDPEPLRTTLATYDLGLLELDARGRVVRVWAMGRTAAHHDAVDAVLHDPASFGSALNEGASARLSGQSVHDGIPFEWGLSIPLFGTGGRMKLERAPEPDAVVVDGVSGAMRAGRWRAEQRAARDGEAFVYTAGDFDIADASWVLRAIIGDSADLAAGLSAAAELMLVRAVRLRAVAIEETAAPSR